ncbi:MAG: Gfo/Idh/MocA family oxidoreductase [Myxococcales bacterium]|nr:Gfo/Idh/MocA family oxidoreductase [Myxococcales bacterium]
MNRSAGETVAGRSRGSDREEVLRIGIVGTGDIVRAVHLPVLQALPGVSVGWIADLDDSRAQALGRAYGAPVTALPSDLTALPGADVVLLATPFGSRTPYFEALRDRRQAIYVEKPFARDGGSHRTLCSQFPESALASGLMMRAFGPTQWMRRIISEGLFGALTAVRVGFGKPGLVTHGRFYFDADRGGAGFVSEVGIHGIDTLLFATSATGFSVSQLDVVRDEEGLDLHTHGLLSLETETCGEIAFEFTLTSMACTREEWVFVFEGALLSYPLVGQGYALVGDTVSHDIRVRPCGGGGVYTLRPESTSMHPDTKFQTFGAYWSDYLRGVRSGEANYTSASAAELTSRVVGALSGEAENAS